LFTELADLIVGQRNARGFFPDDDEVFGTKALPDLCLNLVDKQIRIHFAGINESPNLSRQRSATGSNGNRLSRLREGWLMNRYRQCRPTYESGSGSLFEPENITSDKLLHKCNRNKGKGQHEDAQDGNNLDDTVVLKVNDEHGKHP
jgi:hypothetical protein